MEGVSGRVAIVTGGANGIGAGIVDGFARAGVRVTIADIVDPAEQALAELSPDAVQFVRADLRRDDDLDAVVDATVQRFGGIDFLLNVACTYADGGFDADRAAWRNGFDINVFGHVMLLQRAHPHLRRSTCASVVNFASASGHIAQAGRWVYPASKAAIEQLTRSQALDLAEDGIRVNALLPGWVRKPWQDTAEPDTNRRYEALAGRLHMLGRLGTLTEIAEAALFLCSAHARFVTGSCLRVDGGYTALGPQGKEKVLPTALRGKATR
ncbi:MAG TPA: SDR family oxidoreductase [Burkholderiaceae bacterium]|nr:SDR family oxidoreductase [Burkholderiaceae bacterium]